MTEDRTVLTRAYPGGTVYLLHFSEPFRHAKHYLGWASNLQGRLNHHEAGTGANLLRHVRAAGITWELARTWPGDRNLERQLKARGHSRKCPICHPELGERLLTKKPSTSGSAYPNQ